MNVGDVLFETTREIDRDRLVRYAGASGDFNPIHWNDRFAAEVGLGGVIAHGMLTMGMAGAALSDHVGVGAIESFGTRFTKPVPVPDPGVVELFISGIVGEVAQNRFRVDLTVSVEGARVLGKAQAWVRA